MLNHYVLGNGLDVTCFCLGIYFIPILLAGANDWFYAVLPGSCDPGVLFLHVRVDRVFSFGYLSVDSLVRLLECCYTLWLLEVNGELQVWSAVFSSFQLPYTVVGTHGRVDAVEYRIRVL